MGYASIAPRKAWALTLTSPDYDRTGGGAVLLAQSSPPAAPPGALLTTHYAEVDRIRILPLDPVASECVVRLFLQSGSSRVLVHEQLVAIGSSPHRGTEDQNGDLDGRLGPVDPDSTSTLGPIPLHGSDKLYVSTTSAAPLNVIAYGTDYFEFTTEDPAPSVTVINQQPDAAGA